MHLIDQPMVCPEHHDWHESAVTVGAAVGAKMGDGDGTAVGADVGAAVGVNVGTEVGADVTANVGELDGIAVGGRTSSLSSKSSK